MDGTVNAIVDILGTCPTDKVRLHIVQYGVGHVSEADIALVKPFQGQFLGDICMKKHLSMFNMFKFDVDIPVYA